MNNELQQVTPFDGYGSEMALSGGGSEHSGQVTAPRPGQDSLIWRAHHNLRGRYWIAVTLGVILSVAGAYLGYKAIHPIYRAEGMLQISLNVQDPMVNQRQSMPNAEEYIQSQSMVLGSRMVIERAMRSEAWSKTGLGTDAKIHTQIADNLLVEHPVRTELIRVYYADRDPEVAVNVVKAIIGAYYEFATNYTRDEDQQHRRLLTSRMAEKIQQISKIDEQIDEVVQAFGIPDVTPLLDIKVSYENKLALELDTATEALAENTGQDPQKTIYQYTNYQISMLDNQMRNLLNKRDEAQALVANLQLTGVMEDSGRMKMARAQVDEAQKKVDQYAVEWRDMQLRRANGTTLDSTDIPKVAEMSKGWLQREVKLLQERYDAVKIDRMAMGKEVLKVDKLKKQRAEWEKDKTEVQRSIDMLNISMGMAGRLNVLLRGIVPVKAFKDRRIPVAVAGGMGCMGLPVMFFLMLGALDKRYRYSDETNDGVANAPLLGILPRLPEELADPEQAAVAAHCIHQIRIMLQVGPNPDRRRVFMVTSTATGDGKTSLTMALGLSFAASGSKTLVVDCDMVGQGLTHRLKAQHVPGLLETLTTGTLRGHVRKTATKGMYILPIGNAHSVDAGSLSPNSIKRLLAACCEHFDIIVIDTGPILGSLEASAVAAEADGVIMAVARGQQQPMVEKAIRHLRSIGANIFGIVFNRAEQRDFQRSVSSTSIRSMSAKSHNPRPIMAESEESSRFGPLARSVASCLPSGSMKAGAAVNGAVNGSVNGSGNGSADAAANGQGQNGHGDNGQSGGNTTQEDTAA
jgi:Mrp family chromosome partitioning ATPase/capsular polysaccharide biosynthesis protein